LGHFLLIICLFFGFSDSLQAAELDEYYQKIQQELQQLVENANNVELIEFISRSDEIKTQSSGLDKQVSGLTPTDQQLEDFFSKSEDELLNQIEKSANK